VYSLVSCVTSLTVLYVVCFKQKYCNDDDNDDNVEDEVHIFGSFVLSRAGVVWKPLIANVMSYFY